MTCDRKKVRLLHKGECHARDAVCTRQVDGAKCASAITKWFYNAYEGTCQLSTYSSCGHVKNRCV